MELVPELEMSKILIKNIPNKTVTYSLSISTYSVHYDNILELCVATSYNSRRQKSFLPHSDFCICFVSTEHSDSFSTFKHLAVN